MASHHHNLRIHENGDDGEMARGIKKSTTPKGVISLHHRPSKRMMARQFRVVLRGGIADDGDNFAAPSPSKRMMVLRFRVVLRGGMTDNGGNFAAPSPNKTNDGAAILCRIARWNDG